MRSCLAGNGLIRHDLFMECMTMCWFQHGRGGHVANISGIFFLWRKSWGKDGTWDWTELWFILFVCVSESCATSMLFSWKVKISLLPECFFNILTILYFVFWLCFSSEHMTRCDKRPVWKCHLLDLNPCPSIRAQFVGSLCTTRYKVKV